MKYGHIFLHFKPQIPQIISFNMPQTSYLFTRKLVGVETATGAQVTYKFIYWKDRDPSTLSSHQIPIAPPLRVGLTPSPI